MRRARQRADSSSTLGENLHVIQARADQPPPEPVLDKPGTIERARGVILDLAVGDALGATLEFSPASRRRWNGGTWSAAAPSAEDESSGDTPVG